MRSGEFAEKLASLLTVLFFCSLLHACGGKCKPECDGKECGYDQCGGTCGFCDIGHLCDEGKCKCPLHAPEDCGSNGCWSAGTDCETVGSCSLSGYNCYACGVGDVPYCCGGLDGRYFTCCPVGWYPCDSLGCAEVPEDCGGLCPTSNKPGDCMF